MGNGDSLLCGQNTIFLLKSNSERLFLQILTLTDYEQLYTNVRFEVLTTVRLCILVFWVATTCGLAGSNRSQMNPVHILTPYFSNNHLKIILPSTPRSSERSLLFRFYNKYLICVICLADIILHDLIALTIF
jgi:hypothetical protein